MDKQQLSDLKRKLPRGWCKTIAAEMGVTQATVSNTMSGKFRRMDIVECAIELARKTTLKTQRNLAEILGDLSEND